MTKFPKRKHNPGQFTNFNPEPENKIVDIGTPEVRTKMKVICKAMEGSIKNGKTLEEAVKDVLNSDHSYSMFVWLYVESYRKITSLRKSRKFKTDGATKKQGSVEIAFSGNVGIYISPEEALIEIYNNYLAEKSKETKDDRD